MTLPLPVLGSASTSCTTYRDAVMIPATDGGYCLLSYRQYQPSLFTHLARSTGVVRQETLGRCVALVKPKHIRHAITSLTVPESSAPSFAAANVHRQTGRNLHWQSDYAAVVAGVFVGALNIRVSWLVWT
ncbi:MAG: hypothetical protein ACKVOO_03110 [Burkholderiaceae bacterium]